MKKKQITQINIYDVETFLEGLKHAETNEKEYLYVHDFLFQMMNKENPDIVDVVYNCLENIMEENV